MIASVFYNLVGWSLVGGAAYKAISPSEPLVSVMSSAFGKAIISTVNAFNLFWGLVYVFAILYVFLIGDQIWLPKKNTKLKIY